MYDIRVASEKELHKVLHQMQAEHLPGRVPKYQNNRIYDNLTEMQPWIYSLKEDRDESFKNGLLKRIIQNEPNQANYGAE